MARVLASFLDADGRLDDVAAFVIDAEFLTPGSTHFEGRPLVALEDLPGRFEPAAHDAIVAVGYAGMNALRADRHSALKAMGYSMASYVHSSVLLHRGVRIGEGAIIYDHVALHAGAIVGDGAFIASNASLGHDAVVGDFGWINSGATLAGHARLGARCFLGVGACVADAVHLGDATYVGANTLVNRDTTPGSVLVSAAGERFPMSSGAFLDYAKRGKAAP